MIPPPCRQRTARRRHHGVERAGVHRHHRVARNRHAMQRHPIVTECRTGSAAAVTRGGCRSAAAGTTGSGDTHVRTLPLRRGRCRHGARVRRPCRLISGSHKHVAHGHVHGAVHAGRGATKLTKRVQAPRPHAAIPRAHHHVRVPGRHAHGARRVGRQVHGGSVILRRRRRRCRCRCWCRRALQGGRGRRRISTRPRRHAGRRWQQHYAGCPVDGVHVRQRGRGSTIAAVSTAAASACSGSIRFQHRRRRRVVLRPRVRRAGAAAAATALFRNGRWPPACLPPRRTPCARWQATGVGRGGRGGRGGGAKQQRVPRAHLRHQGRAGGGSRRALQGVGAGEGGGVRVQAGAHGGGARLQRSAVQRVERLREHDAEGL